MFSSLLGYFLGAAGILLSIYLFNSNCRQKKNLETLSRKVYQLKTEHHDFKHHLQLLLTLYQMKKHDEALNYLSDLVSDLQRGEMKTYSGLPALDGLLHYKQAQAVNQGIELDIDISTDLKQLPLSNPSICKIIGNLLDNGIEHLKKIAQEKRFLQLKINETAEGFEITTTNPVSGDTSFPGGIERIFEPGFSSKGRGRGLGLAIINQLVSEAGGEIETRLDSAGDTIVFIIRLPRKIHSHRFPPGRSANK